MAWNAKEIETLRALHADGLSFGLIANQLRKTRNSVIGKAMRIGLHRRTTLARLPMPARLRRPAPKKPKLVWNNPMSARARSIRALELPGEPLPPPQETDIGRKQLADLNEKECRWPCLEPSPGQPQMFCAAAAMDGLVYCPDHARRAYQPPQPRYRAPAPAPVPSFADAVKEDA